MVRRLSGLQKKLLLTAFDMLKPGGTLVYSTCTLEPEEDEEVVSTLLNSRSAARIEPFELPLKRSSPVTEFMGKKYHEDVKHCLRIYPQDNDTEGFFVAKIIKER